MKTLKILKLTAILNGIFCLCCIASNICFALHRYYDIHPLFGIEGILLYGWFVNPVGIITFTRGLAIYKEERKIPEEKKIIGLKWIWIFIWFIITIVFWLFGGVLFVYLTGGV